MWIPSASSERPKGALSRRRSEERRHPQAAQFFRARKHNRVVQMGNQRRSWPWVIEAIAKVRGGEIGRITFARCWYNNARGTIGRGKTAAVPAWLDYSLWQGPARETCP